MTHETRNNTIWGALIIGFGMLLLLGNLGILQIGADTIFGIAFAGFWGWLATRVVAGADPADRAFYVVRLVLAAFLGLVALTTFIESFFGGGFSIGWLWSLFWPVILIGGGVFLILRSTGHTGAAGTELAASSTAALGKVVYGRNGETLGNTQLSVGAGDVQVDLTHGTLPPGETVIDIALGIGDIEVLVPRDLAVMAEVQAALMDVTFLGRKTEHLLRSEHYASADYESAPRRVRLVVRAGIGDLDVARLG